MESTSYHLTVSFDQETQLRAIRRFLLRSFGWPKFVWIGLFASFFLYEFAKGERDWLVGALGTALLIFVALPLAVYRVYANRSLERLRQMKRKSAEVILTEESVSLRSDLGAGEVPWSQFIELWRYSDMWLLFHAKNAFITLPVRDLTPDSQMFIERKVREAGGSIM